MINQELKLEIRDMEFMLVARLGATHDTQAIPIATMNRAIADAHPQAFEKFKAFTTDLLKMMLEEAGAEVHGFMEQPVDAGAPGHA